MKKDRSRYTRPQFNVMAVDSAGKKKLHLPSKHFFTFRLGSVAGDWRVAGEKSRGILLLSCLSVALADTVLF